MYSPWEGIRTPSADLIARRHRELNPECVRCAERNNCGYCDRGTLMGMGVFCFLVGSAIVAGLVWLVRKWICRD
jgi:hypothetical protein